MMKSALLSRLRGRGTIRSMVERGAALHWWMWLPPSVAFGDTFPRKREKES